MTLEEVGFQSLKIIKEKMVYLYTNSISVHVTNVTLYINNIKYNRISYKNLHDIVVYKYCKHGTKHHNSSLCTLFIITDMLQLVFLPFERFCVSTNVFEQIIVQIVCHQISTFYSSKISSSSQDWLWNFLKQDHHFLLERKHFKSILQWH